MRIALDEIDPHIAAMYAVTAPAQTTRAAVTRRPRPRLSRRRRLALAASSIAPPIIGLQAATMAASAFGSFTWLPWTVWGAIWIVGASAGSLLALRGQAISRKPAALVALNAAIAPLIGLGLGIVTTTNRPVSSLSFFLTWLLISMPIALVGNRIALNVTPRATTIAALQTENMRDVFASISLTRAERVYCDVLMFLARAQPNEATEQMMRATLTQLNDLMQNSRQLEEQRLALLPLMGANVVPELRTEYDALKTRLDAASDPITRSSLEQSRRMILSRIEDAHNLQTGLERLNTQQEAIAQTLQSALSSLGRMQVTASSNAEFAMQDIAETVTHINRQTVAVESAVEEVLTLRSSA